MIIHALHLHPMKSILTAIIALILLQACSSNKRGITEEEVKLAIDRFDMGWKYKNPTLVDSVLSASYMYFTQSGGTFSRENVVQTAGSPEYKLDSMVRKQFEIKIEGNTAVVNTIWAAKGTYYGKRFKDKQRCSITLIKHDNKVEILSEHCTPIR